MCEAQAAATGPTNIRMSDVSGIYAAPLCLTTQHNTAVGPSVRQAEAWGTRVKKWEKTKKEG